MVPDLETFRTDNRGAVALIFALSMVPVLGLAGGVLDYVTAAHKRTHIQDAVDAAALNAAKSTWSGEAELRAQILAQMTPRLNERGIKPDEWRLTQATDAGGRITAAAEATVKPQFLKILQIDSITVSASSSVVRERNLEVALVLDNTGSMGNGTGRIEALRAAATKLVDKVFQKKGAESRVRVALVPFVTTVNIKADPAFSMDWIDQTALSPHHGVNFDLEDGKRVSHLTLFTRLGVPWKGCVEARAEPHDTLDTTPNPLDANTLFVPWFWPDEPNDNVAYTITDYRKDPSNENHNYLNDYLGDKFDESDKTSENAAAKRQRNVAKYTSATWRKTRDESATVQTSGSKPTITIGPNKTCPEPLTPLTDDVTTMRQRIAAMQPWDHSGTNVPQGMVWGWSVLSPEAPFTEGAAWSDSTTQKAMIVLTDGENMVYGGLNTHNKSDYTSYGYLGIRDTARSRTDAGRLGTTSRSAAIDAVDAKLKGLCENVKAKKIRLYMITFQLNDADAQQMYRECATSPSLYYNSPTTAQLDGVFDAIATDLGKLRIED